METVMTRMVSGLKLNATIRVSKIPNSRAPEPAEMLQGTQTFFLWSSRASYPVSLVSVKRVERCNWTRFKLNSAREMKKELGVEELRDT